MSKLSAIVRNRETVTVEILGADGETRVPITVTYRPRMNTLAFRQQFGEHMQALQRVTRAMEAAQAREDWDELDRLNNDPASEEVANKMTAMTLGLIEGWDLEDEDDKGKTIAVPFPTNTEEIKTFVAPEMFQDVLKAVMEKLNPNRTADGETSSTPSETPPSAT